MARRPFQFHLSTMLILVLVAGTFVCGNINTYRREIESSNSEPRLVTYTLGWPIQFRYRSLEVIPWHPAEDGKPHEPPSLINARVEQGLDCYFLSIADVASAVLLVVALTRFADRFPRRRDTRLTPDSPESNP